jgi:4-amino-4-deoxy-L-arabinose transferase-like glycosyltransferase
VLSIGVVGLALRVIGLSWGLPYDMHPDESVILATVEQMSWGDLNPGFFIYPGLFVYQIFFVHEVVTILGGAYEHVVLAARLLAVTYGWLTIWFVYLLGARLGGRRVGVVGAGLLAVMGAATLHSHYAVTDTPVAALVTATVWLSVRAWQQRSYAGLAVAAVVAGFAVSTKYSAVPVCFVPWLGFVALAEHQRAAWSKRLTGTAVLAGLAILAFLITSPYTVLDYQGFVRDLGIERQLQAEGRAGAHVDPLENPNLAERGLVANVPAMAADMGIPAFILALTGLIAVIARLPATLRRVRRTRGATGHDSDTDPKSTTPNAAHPTQDGVGWALAAAWVLLYYAFMSPSAIAGQRYVLPLYPVLMLFAAGGIALLLDKLVGGRRKPSGEIREAPREPVATTVAALLFVAAAAVPAWHAVSTTRLLALRDTRLVARDWIIDNMPQGAHLAREYYAPSFHTSDGFAVSQPFSLTEHSLETYCTENVQYLILSSLNSARYFESDTDRFAAQRAWYGRLDDRTRVVERFDGVGDLELHHPTIEIRRLFCGTGD